MNRKLVAVIMVSSLVIAAGLLTAYKMGIILSSNPVVTVDGGAIRTQSEEELDIWCFKPEVSLRLDGYDGQVRLLNCVPGSTVEGVESYEYERNTSILFRHNGDSASISVRPPAKGDYTFAVLGDSQGRNEVLRTILSESTGCEFALLCGDLTPSGMPAEFAAVQDVLDESPIPVYSTPGNHDAKNDGIDEYEARFGQTSYSFSFGGLRFAVVDSSDLNVTEEQVSWMREEFSGYSRKVVMTHAPCFDPYGDDHTLFPDSADRLLRFVESDEIEVVFSGHIHAFNHTVIGETDFIITGGAGGSLVEGEHHFVNVAVSTLGSFSFEKAEVEVDSSMFPHVTLVGRDGGQLNLTHDEMLTMTMEDGYSSFENLYGNIGGAGNYSGIPVADLLELIGGMVEGDVMRVTSSDGYLQEFGYLNVYPTESWLGLQGEIVIAFGLESEVVPQWGDGPKLIMLAPDGLYSNTDCEATSYDGQGYSVYPSAGARWVKCVASVEVIPCPP
jgi:predicted phosphodiesterase